ncbi:MAG: ABC transporter substrate-binding protein [Phaeospirillum sp.]|nr:ABC transporter substrate-binding protein [Phaeospirillum sp.]
MARWIGYRMFVLGLAAILIASLGVFVSVEAISRFHRTLPVTIGVVNHAMVADAAFAGFRDGMVKLGWKEGDSVRYLYDGATGAVDRLDDVVLSLVARKSDLVLALSTPAALAAVRNTAASGIPVVFAPASAPVQAGIVTSLIEPGGNATGVTFGIQEPARLRWLKRLAPSVRRVLFPYNPIDPSPVAALANLQPTAEKLGLTLVPAHVRDPAELTALARSLPVDIDAVFVPPDALVASHLTQLTAACLARKLPVTVPQMVSAKMEGVLFSYGFSLEELGGQAAHMADQILRGVRPADLPVEVAEFQLSLDLRTARTLGLHIPTPVLRQARVIIH